MMAKKNRKEIHPRARVLTGLAADGRLRRLELADQAYSHASELLGKRRSFPLLNSHGYSMRAMAEIG